MLGDAGNGIRLSEKIAAKLAIKSQLREASTVKKRKPTSKIFARCDGYAGIKAEKAILTWAFR